MRSIPVLVQFVFVLLIATVPAGLAETRVPVGLLNASLTRWEGTWEAGELVLALDSVGTYHCRFDGRTFFEREGRRIPIARLMPGDRLEVMSDRTTQNGLCFARRVKVVTGETVADLTRRSVRATDHFAPRGNLVYAGVVIRLDAKQLVLRMKDRTEQTIRLRPDTRFVSGGSPELLANLLINERVFVRAGLNLEDEVEAYQVVRGEILQPELRGPRP